MSVCTMEVTISASWNRPNDIPPSYVEAALSLRQINWTPHWYNGLSATSKYPFDHLTAIHQQKSIYFSVDRTSRQSVKWWEVGIVLRALGEETSTAAISSTDLEWKILPFFQSSRKARKAVCCPLRTKCTPKSGIFALRRPKLTESCLPVPSVCTIFHPIFIVGQWARGWHVKMYDNYIGQEKIAVCFFFLMS